MHAFHLLGSGSPIAKSLSKKLSLNSDVFLYSSSGHGGRINDFLSKALENSTVIYFCNIQDDLDANIKLLNRVIGHCKNFNCKFIYISSINAETPNASLYSRIKYECEKIVHNNGYIYIRLAIVVSEPPISSYRALKNLRRLPIKFVFDEGQYIHFTDINQFLSIDFHEITSSTNLYGSSMSLNDFFKDSKRQAIKINMQKCIFFLKILNSRFPVKSIFGRLLTLTAFNRDFLK